MPRGKHSSVYSRGGPWNSDVGALQALRLTDISLLFHIFVINHLKSEIKLKYLNT
jgi:predicted phosphatase